MLLFASVCPCLPLAWMHQDIKVVKLYHLNFHSLTTLACKYFLGRLQPFVNFPIIFLFAFASPAVAGWRYCSKLFQHRDLRFLRLPCTSRLPSSFIPAASLILLSFLTFVSVLFHYILLFYYSLLLFFLPLFSYSFLLFPSILLLYHFQLLFSFSLSSFPNSFLLFHFIIMLYYLHLLSSSPLLSFSYTFHTSSCYRHALLTSHPTKSELWKA